jgi:hypothetical protein
MDFNTGKYRVVVQIVSREEPDLIAGEAYKILEYEIAAESKSALESHIHAVMKNLGNTEFKGEVSVR